MNKKLFLPLFMILILTLNVFSLTTLSVSNIDFKINDGKWTKSFLISGIIGADEASYIEASKMVDTVDGAKATKNFQINTKVDSFTCDYQYLAKSTSNPGYIISYRQIRASDWSAFSGWTSAACYDTTLTPLNSNEYVTMDYRIFGSPKVGCVIAEKKFVTGYLSQSRENMQITTTISNGEKIETQTTTTQGQKTLEFEDATFSYSGGGLVTSRKCPEAVTTNQVTIKNIGSSTFYLTDASLVQTYETLRDNLASQIQQSTSISSSANNQIQLKIDEVNNAATKIYNTKNNVLRGQDTQVYSLTYDTDKARIVLTGVYPILPLATIRVNADFVGIVLMCGKPQISGLSDISLTSGLGKTQTFTIKNVGDFASQFDIYSSCGGNIAEDTNTLSLSKGQSAQTSLNFNSNSNTNVCDKCTITAQSTNCPSEKVTATINVCSKPELSCTEGATSCLQDKLLVCRSNSWITEKTCELGCIQDGTKGYCKVKDPVKEICDNNIDDDGDGLVDMNDTKDCGSNPSTFLLVLSLIIGGVATFYSMPLVGRIPKKNKWIRPIAYVIIFVVATILAALIIKYVMTQIKSLFTFNWWS